MKNILLFTATVAGIAAIVFASTKFDNKDNAAHIPFSKKSAERPETTQLAAQWSKDGTSADSAKHAAGTDPQRNWQSLEQEFIKAQSFRAFFYNALKNPQQGGYYYAMKSLSVCKNLPKPDTQNLSAPRAQAAAELAYRCDFTEQDYADAQRQLDALRDFKFANDPLFSRMFDFLAAGDQAKRADIIKQTIRDGNPDVIASIVYPSLEASVFLSSAKPQEIPAYLKFAPSLIACELGADCGPNSTRALELCTHTGWCGAGVREELRAGLGNNFDNLNVLANRTVAYVRNGELDRLSLLAPKPVDRTAPRTIHVPHDGHSDAGTAGMSATTSDH